MAASSLWLSCSESMRQALGDRLKHNEELMRDRKRSREGSTFSICHIHHPHQVPTGFKGYGVKTRSVRGHEFGLNISAEDKKALIAFLKTL